jgi:hypothetical protein
MGSSPVIRVAADQHHPGAGSATVPKIELREEDYRDVQDLVRCGRPREIRRAQPDGYFQVGDRQAEGDRRDEHRGQ